ncbi:MAG: YggT family protein [Clostridiales bacterium]|nr:YggT family protein [Clostridiales bacterium]
MVLKLIVRLAHYAIYLFELTLIVYAVYPFFSKIRSTFYQTLSRICEPVLIPIRRLLTRYLPRKWQRIDFSPLVAILLCGVATMILNGIAFLL